MHVRDTQRGATLIELMIAMTVTTMVVWMLFAINNKMSRGMHQQNHVSELNATVRAVRSEIFGALYHAGYGLPSGRLNVSTTLQALPIVGNEPLPAVLIRNNSDDPDDDGTPADGPDQISSFYINDAETHVVSAFTVAAGVISFAPTNNVSSYSVGELIVLTSENSACLLEVTAQTSILPTFTLTAAPADLPFNNGNTQCQPIQDALTLSEPVILNRFAAQGYRISQDNLGQGVTRETGILEFSPTGGLQNDWTPLAAGIANIQVAVRFFEDTDPVDADLDGDPERDWYSSENMEVDFLLRPTNGIPAGIPFEVNFSIEVKSRVEVETATAQQTPEWIDSGDPDNNQLGDWDLVDLTAPAASRPVGYQSQYLYRWVSSRIFLRNVGVQ